MSLTMLDVRCRYGRREVLKGVSFCLNKGEVVFILGQNGAGKTTLFKCMLGLITGYGGSVLYDGQEVRRFSPGQLARKVAYIPQAHQPQFNYSVLEVVLMGLASSIGIFSVPSSAQRLKAEQLLEKIGIPHLKNRGYANLSGGERQMVLIARALMQGAEILLMDEPVASLDYGNQQRILSMAAALAKEGYAVAVTSHHPEHAFLYAGRVLVLEKGRVAAQGEPGAVLTEELLCRIYDMPIRLLVFRLDHKEVRICVPVDQGMLGGWTGA